jgi:nitroimidazol reductase NimA-like FMN-containing flavoprotein (pyridoxamine 5'-phosphate oxidase superfamily)
VAKSPESEAHPELETAWLGELERLSTRECLTLLRSRELGRVGFEFAQRPVILPVNYRVIANGVVFRVAPGTTLSAALLRARVAFEVDDADADGRSGWSVLAVGHATELHDDESVRQARQLGVSPWAPGEHEHFVIVPVDEVSGRRFTRS